MGYVQKLVTEDSFDAYGVFVPAGHIGTFDTELLNGEEKHLQDPSGFVPARVEISAIAPTGPNPTAPQQIPPDAVQTPGGGYVTPGKVLVGEVTNPQEVRLEGLRDDSNEAEVTEKLSDIMDVSLAGQVAREQNGSAAIPTNPQGGKGATTGNGDDALVAGTVADVTKDLGSKTDEQLAAIAEAEKDREQPRVGVLKAVEAEQAARKANANS